MAMTARNFPSGEIAAGCVRFAQNPSPGGGRTEPSTLGWGFSECCIRNRLKAITRRTTSAATRTDGRHARRASTVTARVVKPLFRILLQAVPHDAAECRRHRAIRLRKFRRIMFQNRAHGLDGTIALKRALPRKHLVQNRAKAEQVRAMIGRQTLHLLGRHVPDRPHYDAGLSL